MIKNILFKILYSIIPVIEVYQKNKIVKKHIDNKELIKKIKRKYNGLSIDTLKMLYQEENKRKDMIENKAKTNIVGLTIAVSIMTSDITKFVKKISANNCASLYIINDFILLITALFFIAAGINAFKCICSENIVNVVKPSSLDNVGNIDEKCKNYIECIYNNRQRNTIRNNLICVSYSCIRNAILFLFIHFFISIFLL